MDNEQPSRFWQKIKLVAEISSQCRRLNQDNTACHDVLELIQVTFLCDAVCLYLFDHNARALRLKDHIGGVVSVPQDLIRQALDPDPDERHEPSLYSASLQGNDDKEPCGAIAAPLFGPDGLMGMLVLGTYVEAAISEKHLRLATIVADQLAISIERMNHVAAIEARNVELEKAHHQLRAVQEDCVAVARLAAVTEFAESVNHQINNPLAVIVGHTQCLLYKHQELDSDIKSRLRRIEAAAMLIAETNRELLSIDGRELPSASVACRKPEPVEA